MLEISVIAGPARSVFRWDRMTFAHIKGALPQRPPQACRKSRRRCLPLLVAVATTCFGTEAVTAAGKQPADWQNTTTVEARAGTNNPVCQQISSNIAKRVASIKGAQAAIAKSAAAPPTSVKSALEDMFGTRQPNAKVLDLERKIKAERKAAEDLNDMLRSSRCAPVDIDAAIANQKIQDRAAPEVPKSMPDDLVRTPHRY